MLLDFISMFYMNLSISPHDTGYLRIITFAYIGLLLSKNGKNRIFGFRNKEKLTKPNMWVDDKGGRVTWK